jgi:hypothetical protein
VGKKVTVSEHWLFSHHHIWGSVYSFLPFFFFLTLFLLYFCWKYLFQFFSFHLKLFGYGNSYSLIFTQFDLVCITTRKPIQHLRNVGGRSLREKWKDRTENQICWLSITPIVCPCTRLLLCALYPWVLCLLDFWPPHEVLKSGKL